MKKAIYYASPFILFSIIFGIFTLLDEIDIINSNILAISLFVLFFVTTAFLGNLSLTNKKFDYLMTGIVPLACFFALFIALFFDEGCDGMPQFSLHHALNIEYYRSWLPIALAMMAITFVFSFKPIRQFIKNKIFAKHSEK